MQKFTSANTSINSKKLPKVYRKVPLTGAVLDYGCGKYVDHIKHFLWENDAYLLPYDPYNQSNEVNFDTMRKREWKSLTDTEYEELPRYVQDRIENKQFDLCDWDGGGYIPDSWLEADAEESKLYEVDERGCRKKTVLDAVYDQYVHDKNLPDEEDED